MIAVLGLIFCIGAWLLGQRRGWAPRLGGVLLFVPSVALLLARSPYGLGLDHAATLVVCIATAGALLSLLHRDLARES